MRKILRRLVIAGVILVVLAYGYVIGKVRLNEAQWVYPGANIVDSQYWLPAADATVPWDTVRVRAPDDESVVLLESRLDDDGTGLWAVFFHGNGGFLGEPGSVQRYELLREAGFNVLAVEFRGYGVSRGAGPPSESGLYTDALGGLNYLTESLGVDPTQIVAYGLSLGSGAATHLAAERPLGGLVTEGAFTSFPDFLSALRPWLPARLILRNHFDNMSRVEALQLPWVVFHGRNDTLFPFSHAEQLVAASEWAQLTTLDAGHIDGVLADREVALAALRALAQEVMGLGTSGG